MSILSDQGIETNNVIGRINLAKTNNKDFLPVRMPTPFLLDEDVLLPLKDIDFVNHVFTYFIDLRKLNRAIEQVNDLQTQINLISNNPTIRQFTLNSFEETLKTSILALLADLEKDTLKIVSETRVLIRESRPWWIRLIRWLTNRKVKDREKKIIAEEKILESEVAEIEAQDQKRIDRRYGV